MNCWQFSTRCFLTMAFLLGGLCLSADGQQKSKEGSAKNSPPKKQSAPQKSTNQQIASATQYLNKGQRFLFEYKLKKGEELFYQAEHSLTEKTTMKKVTDKLASRSRSLKK